MIMYLLVSLDGLGILYCNYNRDACGKRLEQCYHPQCFVIMTNDEYKEAIIKQYEMEKLNEEKLNEDKVMDEWRNFLGVVANGYITDEDNEDIIECDYCSPKKCTCD